MSSAFPDETIRPPCTWFLTDVDGTLLDEDNALPPENRAALERLKTSGIPVIPATGRRWTTLKRVIDRLELWPLVDYAIFNNGMVVKDLKTGSVIHKQAFPAGAVTEAARVLDTLGWDPIALAYQADGGADVFHRRLSLRNGDFIAKNEGYCVEIRDFAELETREVVELILIGSRDDLARAERALEPLGLETALIKNTFYADHMLEVTPRGVSKRAGAERLAAHLGRTLEEAGAIGDSANDLTLLRAAGRSAAMPHAPQPVREAAQEVATVAEAVARWFPAA